MGACEAAPVVLHESLDRPWVTFLCMATACAAVLTKRPRAVEGRLAKEHVVPVGWPTVGGSTAAGCSEDE